MQSPINGPLDATQQIPQENLHLMPLKLPHERKTFATSTLKLINSRLQYYRHVLNSPEPTNKKSLLKRERIKNKYIRDMKVRNLLNRAVRNLYNKNS